MENYRPIRPIWQELRSHPGQQTTAAAGLQTTLPTPSSNQSDDDNAISEFFRRVEQELRKVFVVLPKEEHDKGRVGVD